MARYEVTGPDGAKYEITAPDNLNESQVLEMVRQQLSGASQQAADRELYSPTSGMSGIDKFRAGIGKAFSDTALGVKQLLGMASEKDVIEARERDRPLMQTGAGMAGNVLGNVAATVPMAFVPGVNTIGGAAAAGAGLGMLQSAGSLEERGKNVLYGAAGGAAVPAAVTGLRTAKAFVEPFYQGGRERIIGRALNSASGGEAPAAIQNLRQAQPLVPGSLPTVGEAAGVPSLAATQRAAMAASPAATNQLTARQIAQNEARIAALQGATPNVPAARAAREAAAGPLYEQARQAGFDPAVAQAIEPQIQALLARVPDDLVAQARTLAQVSGEPITDMGSVQGAHYLKRAIDARINQARRGGDTDTARAFSGLQTAYLDVLDQLNPTYRQARQTYAQMSAPVRQGQVMEAIGQQGTNFRGDLTPAAFSRAATDRTAQAVTRRPDATLANSLDPQQLQAVRNVQADLLRSDYANTAGRGVGSNTVQNLAYTNLLDSAGVPSWLRGMAPAGVVGNVGQRFGQIAYRDANERITAELAEAMLDPQRAAQLMTSGMVTPQMQALIQGLRSGGAALGASAPGLIQANQQ
jgi:hypothetical protein